jgi:hypothetical protein
MKRSDIITLGYALSIWFYSPLNLGHFFSLLILYIVGRTLLTGDQPVSRPLNTQDNTNPEQTHTDIHVSSGFRTHDSTF